ncbi:MAG: SBBP repeat-containing protein, partial [Terriglobia bacterium]
MKLVGANAKARVTGLAELPGKSNYFIGNDPKKWRTNVPNYARVRYQNVYPGIDLVYYGNQGQLEYDFVVAPGADPGAIVLDVAPASSRHAAKARREHGEGMAPLHIAANGDLVMRLNGGEIRFHKPAVYQSVAAGFNPAIENHNPCPAKAGLYEAPQPCVAAGLVSLSTGITARSTGNPKSAIQNRKYLDGRYVLTANNRVRFAVASYDRSQPLIIDPVLTYSSLLGGSDGDFGNAIAVDSSGNAYVTGLTSAVDFPQVNQIPGACNGTCSGSDYDAFVTKINAAGSALVYSSLIGGSGFDESFGIAVDGSCNAYLTGLTTSADFPQVNQIPGACNGTCGSGASDDVFVTEVD